MININLLPNDMRKGTQDIFGMDAVIYFSKVGLVILILAHLLLVSLYLFYKFNNSRLEKKWNDISLKSSDIITIKKDISLINDKNKFIDKICPEPSNWAMRLNKLSLLIPAGSWINKLRIEKGNLDIAGSVVSLKGDEIEVLNKYLEALKSDALFSSGLKSIDIISILQNSIFSVEVYNFSLRAIFSE